MPLFRPAALGLALLAVLLVAVHRGDRRDAWRYVAEPVMPARFLPPLRPTDVAYGIDPTAPTEPAEPTGPVIGPLHVPTQPLPLFSLPTSRVSGDGAARR